MELSFFLLGSVILALIITVFPFVVFNFVSRGLYGNSSRTKKYHPIAGTVLNQLLNFHRLHHYMTELASKYRTYRLLNLFHTEVYTADPANVEYILKTNFENYGKGSYNYSCLSDLLGDGIFTVDGDKWRQQRKISSYEFSTKVLRDYSCAVFRRSAAKLANTISKSSETKQTINIQDLFLKSTLDSIFKVAFGAELDSLSGSSEEGSIFGDAFNQASAMTLFRYVDIFWKIRRYFNTGSERVLKKNLEVIDNFVYGIINAQNKGSINSPCDSSMKGDLLSRFKLVETNPKYLRDIILNFVIAGRDTTAVTLSWFVYMICKHPAVEEKVVREINTETNITEARNFTECADSLTESSLEKMQYLHAALTETLRLYPAVPVDAKFCFKDDTFPDGFHVRKGSMVAYQPYAMGRMKFIWGEDAESFQPERWLNQNGCFRPESPFKFTAFQAGPRICLGKEFAYRQMKIFAAVLLGCFKFRLADGTAPVNYKTMINLHINGGLCIRAVPRQCRTLA